MWVENYTQLSDLEKEGVRQTREGVLTQVMINGEAKINEVGLMVQKQWQTRVGCVERLNCRHHFPEIGKGCVLE